jgi:hypothetical protein
MESTYIVKETVKVKCPYCGAVHEVLFDKAGYEYANHKETEFSRASCCNRSFRVIQWRDEQTKKVRTFTIAPCYMR